MSVNPADYVIGGLVCGAVAFGFVALFLRRTWLHLTMALLLLPLAVWFFQRWWTPLGILASVACR